MNFKYLCTTSEMELIKTFECGQCFRWNADEKGVYSGVAFGKKLFLYEEDDKVMASYEDEDLELWRHYFDLDTDYSNANEEFLKIPYLKTCMDFGLGIRILRQEPFEALCSFIISQCNNIPRIKGIIKTLCQNFGEDLGEGYYSFPSAEILNQKSLDDLAVLRSGYRAKYLLSAAKEVFEGSLNFDELNSLSLDQSFKRVLALHGVGAKVANCFMLFGLHQMERFPIDVWMKRALKENFPEDFDPKTLGDFAGLAQQYIFYYARSQSMG